MLNTFTKTKFHPLAAFAAGAVFATVLVGHAQRAEAATVAVTNCNNSGPGSLRAKVAAASSGDTVDLGNVGCQKITLTSGAIDVHQADLTIRGPGFRKMSVSGNSQCSVFRQYNSGGTLRLRGMTIEHGVRESSLTSQGGCVYSSGNVNLYDVDVRHCRAIGSGTEPWTQGGGVFALGNVNVAYSGIYSNVVDGGTSGGGYGGGIWASGKLTLNHARIHNNNAMWQGGGFVAVGGLTMNYTTVSANRAFIGGGLYVFAPWGSPVGIMNSTISDNLAEYAIGGIEIYTSGARSIVLIINSTVSGNEAPIESAGEVLTPQANTSILNSTIAFNRNVSGTYPAGIHALGLQRLQLESSIIANNTMDGSPGVDLGASRISGANNLVMLNSGAPLPPDTLRSDPMLAPLADNGGRTLTHALLQGSPAIDHGSNVGELPYDQRGVGFPRVKGARADIGAFER